MDLPRDKDDVIKEVSLPRYHVDKTLEQEGCWVLVAAQPRAWQPEGVPVMEQRHRVLMQRYQSKEEAMDLSVRDSAMRVMGGWALNLRTGETVRVNPMR